MPNLENLASEAHENGAGTGCRVGVGVFLGRCVNFSLTLGGKIVKSRCLLCCVSFLKPAYGMLDVAVRLIYPLEMALWPSMGCLYLADILQHLVFGPGHPEAFRR